MKGPYVFFPILRDDARKQEVLKLFMSTEAEHFITAPRIIFGPKICMNQVEQSLKVPCTFVGKHGCKRV